MKKKEAKVVVTYKVLGEKLEVINLVKKETDNVDGLILLMQQETKDKVKEENKGIEVVIESVELLKGDIEKVIARLTKCNLELLEK